MEFARYHVIKASREWVGRPYKYVGDSLEVWLDFHFVESARDVVNVMNKKNPVGWIIIDSKTGEVVE